MSLEIPFGIKRTTPGFVDEYYGLYTGLTQALNSIPNGIRIEGLTCGILSGQTVTEYWFNNGINDINLVPKVSTITSFPFSGLTNIPTTLEGYGISSGDTLFDNKYLPITGITFSAVTSALGYIPSSGTSIYNRSSPATRNVGGVSIGDNIANLALDVLFERILAPYTAPTITNTVLTPNPSPYNQTGITYNVTFRWVKNTGTPAFVSAQIQYKRSSSSIWLNLATTPTVINPTTEDASATVLVNSGGTDNTSVQFQGIFTDVSQVQTGATATATFSAYVAPSISLSVGTTPREVGNINTNLTGTITRNSINVNLLSYVLQYEVNGSSTYNFLTGATIGIASGTINTTDNNSSLSTSLSIGYRALVTDTQQTTTGATQIVTFLYRIFYGPSSSVPATSADVRGLSNSQLTNASNTFILNTGTAFVNFVLGLPPGKTLVSVIDLDALNLNITSQYVGSSFTVNDFAGNPVTYNVLVMSQSVPYATSHRHSITIA